MPSIVEYLNRRSGAVTSVVDETFFRLMESTAPIDTQIPVTSYQSRKLLLVRFKRHRPTLAHIVAPGQEIPMSKPAVSLSEDQFGNLKIGKKLGWTEPEFELLHELTTGVAAGNAQLEAEIKRHFFGAITDLVPAVYEKSLYLALMIATTGSCTFTDPITGAQVRLTYPTESFQFPTALAGNARWSQPATATPLANLEAHARSMYDVLGMWMPVINVHWSDIRRIATTTEAMTAYLRQTGATGSDTTGIYLKDEQVIALILERTRATSVNVFDAQLSEEQADGSIVDKYFFPEDYYFFSRPGYMERAFVPTVEKDFQPGLFTINEVDSKAPRVESSTVVGNVIPFVADARYLAARKIA